MKIRAALVGCGRIGFYTRPELRQRLGPNWFPLNHLESMLAVSTLDVVGACDVSKENLLRVQRQYGINDIYHDYREMVQRARPELLSIATRTPGRLDIIDFSANHNVRGLHVEKPLGTQLKACVDAMIACEGKGIAVSYGTTRRFMDVFRHAKMLLQDGAIGSLVEIHLQYGEGQLFWTHPHSIDTMLYFNDGILARKVSADCELPPEAAGDTLIIDADPVIRHAAITFENGVTGIISRAPGGNAVLLGTKGQIEILGECSRLLIRKFRETGYGASDENVEVESRMSGTQRAFAELAAAINGERNLGITKDEIVEGVRILLLIALSAQRRGAEVVPGDLHPEYTVTGRTGELYA